MDVGAIKIGKQYDSKVRTRSVAHIPKKKSNKRFKWLAGNADEDLNALLLIEEKRACRRSFSARQILFATLPTVNFRFERVRQKEDSHGVQLQLNIHT